ncbi:PP2C family protein-serine/threonine phosphatase [Algivirga pacifica]|uniref:PPM-type phosphatase domain-containing protein n=1 Tax=Algivirga pacifica TaxID=1162670 RepID=A0ABP9DEQ3_9BACT
MLQSTEEYIKHLELENEALKEQNASQLSMYEMTTLYLKRLQEELRESEKNLIATNKKLTDSINYAKHIQDAFVVGHHSLQQLIPESFILYLPKDIVSGDFVWTHQQGKSIYLGVGDCTGHGVPRAMLSIFVISMLNHIVSHFNVEDPVSIIRHLDRLVQEYVSNKTADSAELAIIKYTPDEKTLVYAGAKRPLVQVCNGEIMVYKGARYTIGSPDRRIEDVVNHIIHVKEESMFYTFSDGYSDQFGGENDRKLNRKRLFTLLQHIAEKPLKTQKNNLAEVLLKWKGQIPQTDDIVVTGLKI